MHHLFYLSPISVCSICPFICIYICLSIHYPCLHVIYLSISMFYYLFIVYLLSVITYHLPIVYLPRYNLSIYLSICLLYLFIVSLRMYLLSVYYLSIYLSSIVYLSSTYHIFIYLSVYLSIYLSIICPSITIYRQSSIVKCLIVVVINQLLAPGALMA